MLSYTSGTQYNFGHANLVRYEVLSLFAGTTTVDQLLNPQEGYYIVQKWRNLSSYIPSLCSQISDKSSLGKTNTKCLFSCFN